MADDFAADHAGRQRMNEPDPDHRRRGRMGGPGTSAEDRSGRTLTL